MQMQESTIPRPPGLVATLAKGFDIIANNIAIIIPCHRVIRSDGHLQGYGGGIDKKKKLIKHEKNVVMTSNETEIDNWF